MFKVVVDNGKPYEVFVNHEGELRELLKEQYENSKENDYAYFDVFVFDGVGNDISESQFITEMIGDIMESD